MPKEIHVLIIGLRVQRIGWQIWDQVYFNAGEDVYRPPPGTQQDDDDSSDWWNNMDADPDASVSSLPLDEWLPMQVHDTGSMFAHLS